MLNINSRTILPLACAYAVITAITLIAFFYSTRNTLKNEGLREQLDLAFRNIETGAPLNNALNNNAFHANYYLGKQMNALEITAPGRYLESKIIAEEGGDANHIGIYVDTYAHWVSKHQMLPLSCLKTYNRFYSSKSSMALFDFRAFITVDDCYPSDLGSREMGFLVLGMTLVILLTIIPFRMLSHFFNSLRRVGDFLGTSDPRIIESVAGYIRIEEIRTLFLRAANLQGENVFHYQSLMKDVKHNILRIILHSEHAVNRLDRSLQNPGADIAQEVKKISNDLKIQLIQLKAASGHLESPLGQTLERDFMSVKILSERVSTLIDTEKVEIDIPDSNVHLNFGFLEPALLNISSNAKAHATKPTAHISKEGDLLRIVVTNKISWWQNTLLNLAQWTRRIDPIHRDKSVYRKIMGREGLGLNMIKKSAHSLGGKMILRWQACIFEVGLEFPVRFSDIITEVKDLTEPETEKKQKKELVIFLKVPENIEEATILGLTSYLRTEEKLKEMLNLSQVEEIIVDHDMELNHAQVAKIRRIKNKWLLRGIAQNIERRDLKRG